MFQVTVSSLRLPNILFLFYIDTKGYASVCFDCAHPYPHHDWFTRFHDPLSLLQIFDMLLGRGIEKRAWGVVMLTEVWLV